MNPLHLGILKRILFAWSLLSLLVLVGATWMSSHEFNDIDNGREILHLLRISARGSTLAVLISVAATALLLYPLMVSLHRKVLRLAEEVAKSNLELASVLGAAIAQRDTGTRGHHFRVTLYAIRFGEALNDARLDMRTFMLGAFLHDVGKIGISDGVLLKPDHLTVEELAIMRTHVRRGLDIISPSSWLQAAREVIECHHEKYDGSGYPNGLRGKAIPLAARIFAIVDAFDALTSRRPYQEPVSFEQAMSILEGASGSHFDPNLMEVFKDVAENVFNEVHSVSESDLAELLAQAVEPYRRAPMLEALL